MTEAPSHGTPHTTAGPYRLMNTGEDLVVLPPKGSGRIDETAEGLASQGAWQAGLLRLIGDVTLAHWRALEVGTRCGVHTSALARRLKHVTAVEASPIHYPLLTSNLVRNETRNAEPLFFTATDGARKIKIEHRGRDREVLGLPLDHVFAAHPGFELLKITVGENAAPVFVGARGLIARSQAVIFEAGDLTEDMAEVLAGHRVLSVGLCAETGPGYVLNPAAYRTGANGANLYLALAV